MRETAIRTALWSAQMEGFHVTPKIESDCRRIVSGEISIEEYIQQMQGPRLSESRDD